MNVVLLAERLRIEERQISEALKARGISSSLVHPGTLAVNVNDATDPIADIVLDRGVTTSDIAALTALLAHDGATVVNRPATSRLLADRLALVRHLVMAGIPVPATRVCFGEEAALNAIGELDYPVVIKTLSVDPAFPSAFVEDRDAAEAIIEHRIILGHDHTTVIQGFQRSKHERSLRAVIVGSEAVAWDARPHDGWRPNAGETYETVDGVPSEYIELVEAVISRVGTGVYAVLMIETDDGPIVTGLENLVTFRHLSASGFTIADKIVEFSLSQQSVTQTR
jgi:[lysine-biosynthesis-protein LysW]---L-2-aminoadipate ligase